LGKSLKKVGKSIGKGLKAAGKAIKKVSHATGLNKVVDGIGRAVKGVVKTFGKWMGELGVVGQLAMFFIMPGIGGALMKGFTSLATWGGSMVAAGQAAGGLMGALQAGAGHLASFVGKAVTTAGNVFANVSKGITDTLGNFADTLGAKMGFDTGGAANFFGSGGADSAMSRSFGESSRFSNLTMNYKEAGKIANAAGEIAKEATKSGVVLTEEAINQQALSKVAEDKAAAALAEVTATAADKGIEAAVEEGIKTEAVESSITTKLDESLLSPKAVEGVTGEAAKAAAQDAATDEVVEKTFMEKVKALPGELIEEAKKLPDKAIEYAKEAPERIMQAAIETPEEAMKLYTSGRVQEEVMKAAHGDDYLAMTAPKTEVTYNTTNVPAIDIAMAPTAFQAPDVTDYRYFMSDISTSPTPYGNTAYQYAQGYQQYMRTLT
jgi:hypothetical protein